jgi:hypothetical protein
MPVTCMPVTEYSDCNGCVIAVQVQIHLSTVKTMSPVCTGVGGGLGIVSASGLGFDGASRGREKEGLEGGGGGHRVLYCDV